LRALGLRGNHGTRGVVSSSGGKFRIPRILVSANKIFADLGMVITD